MNILIWASFFLFIVILLALDLGVFHKKAHEVKTKEALGWTIFWIAIALVFNIAVYVIYDHNWYVVPSSEKLTGAKAATLFFSAYLVEKSLSIDNIFVIAMIFAFFKIPLKYQHRLLFWGVLGAIIFRGIMIVGGISLISQFSWLVYVLGALLLVTAIKMLVLRHDNLNPNDTWVVRFIRKFFKVSNEFDGNKLFTKINGSVAITPMGVALVLIESFDLLFAIDSIPAVMAITLDPFLIFTSNVFAMLGLRSLYFALGGIMDRFRYLKMSLVFILAFVGVKMILSHHFPIHPLASLGVILGILGVGIIASLTSSHADKIPLKSPLEEDLERLSKTTLRSIKKLFVFIIGSTLLLLGATLVVTPGPGIPILIVGLIILGTEFVWAKIWLSKVRQTMDKAEKKAKKLLHIDNDDGFKR